MVNSRPNWFRAIVVGDNGVVRIGGPLRIVLLKLGRRSVSNASS